MGVKQSGHDEVQQGPQLKQKEMLRNARAHPPNSGISDPSSLNACQTVKVIRDQSRVRSALSNQNPKTFQEPFLISQGLKITEVGSAIFS